MITNCSAAVLLLCRYNGDAVIKVKVNGIGAGIKHISVRINIFGNNIIIVPLLNVLTAKNCITKYVNIAAVSK